MLGNLVWGSPSWLIPAAILVAVALAVLLWSYLTAPAAGGVRLVCGLLKAAGILGLAICLIEPMFSGTRPRPGANVFVVMSDNSQSLHLRDQGEDETRGELLLRQLDQQSDWQTRLSQDFDVRRYVFDRRVKPVSDFSEMSLDGGGSSLFNSLRTVARRYEGRPTAGVLLFSDGNATDIGSGQIDWSKMPPVYPVVLGADQPARDIAVSRVSTSHTNFEAAPVTVQAEITSHGYADETIVAELLDDAGNPIERQLIKEFENDKPLIVRFQLKPDRRGVSFYQVRAFMESDETHLDVPAETSEATLVNNRRLLMVDRGGGPYRVLYVTGRPNWEFKFLRRAVAADEEVDLVGLVRIARREPKFAYRGRQGESTNPLFRGFTDQDPEALEQFDDPVLIRLGTEDKEELRDGFPQAADQLFRYHAIVLDDVEADFFSQDQKSLIQEFVSARGGGLLMLGGQESFVKGGYDRTPIGELLPVYVNRAADASIGEGYRLSLTRHGWLQPWVRVRSTEPEERERLDAMPAFRTVNRVVSIKPGADVLATVESKQGERYPALVVQRFGKGTVGALVVGDMWRWQLRQEPSEPSDLQKSWRQTIRWLVADVPRRIEIDVRQNTDDPNLPIEISAKVRDASFKPLDNATVRVDVTTPDGKQIKLTAEPSNVLSGVYDMTFVPRVPGAYRTQVIASAADGSEVGRRETGWAFEPSTDEFTDLRPNRTLLAQIARETGGEMIEADKLDAFVRDLPNRKIPVTEPWIYPLWHQWTVFLCALGCLVLEWGIRRWKGLP